jgi:hypothetical protein
MLTSCFGLVLELSITTRRRLYAFSTVPTNPSRQRQCRRSHVDSSSSQATTTTTLRLSSALVALPSWERDTAILESEEARGLLFGMHDLSKEHFFVESSSSSSPNSKRKMDLSSFLDNLEWLDEPDLFWSAAIQDAHDLGFSSAEEYVTTVSHSLRLYLDSTVRLEEEKEQQQQDLPLHEQYLEEQVSQARGGRGQLTFLLGASHGKSRALHNQLGQPWIQAIARGKIAECTHFPLFVQYGGTTTVTTTSSSSSNQSLSAAAKKTKKNNKNQVLAQAIGWATHDIQYVFGRQEILSLATTLYEKALVEDAFDGFEKENDELMISSLEQLRWLGGARATSTTTTSSTTNEEEEGPVSSACFEKLVTVLQGLQRERQRLEEQKEEDDGYGDGDIQSELARLMGIGARRKKNINLIIDKAEQFMNPNDAETRDALQTLLYWCGKGLNVFLVSSDLNYRWDLLGRKQHVALSHPSMVTNVVIAGDRSPCQLWNLMVHAKYNQKNHHNHHISTGPTNYQGSWRTLGFGPRLAKLFLAAYGGHLKTFDKVLSDLYIEQYDFVASSTLPVHVSDSVKDCLQVLGTRELLMDLARHGFVPLLLSNPFSNEAVQRICKSGIGGVVCNADQITGLPVTVWSENYDYGDENGVVGGCKYGLIPILQSTRIVIADVLVMNPPVADKLVVYRYKPPTSPQQHRANISAEPQLQEQMQLSQEAQLPDQLQSLQEATQVVASRQAKQALEDAIFKANKDYMASLTKEERHNWSGRKAAQYAKQSSQDAVFKAKGDLLSNRQRIIGKLDEDIDEEQLTVDVFNDNGVDSNEDDENDAVFWQSSSRNF